VVAAGMLGKFAVGIVGVGALLMVAGCQSMSTLSGAGGQGLVVGAPWPDYDPALTQDSVLTLPVQVNGKRRGEIQAPAGAEPAEVEKMVLDDPEIARRLEGLTIRKVIVVKDRIVNIVAA